MAQASGHDWSLYAADGLLRAVGDGDPGDATDVGSFSTAQAFPERGSRIAPVDLEYAGGSTISVFDEDWILEEVGTLDIDPLGPALVALASGAGTAPLLNAVSGPTVAPQRAAPEPITRAPIARSPLPVAGSTPIGGSGGSSSSSPSNADLLAMLAALTTGPDGTPIGASGGVLDIAADPQDDPDTSPTVASAAIAPVPVPAGLALMLSGLGALMVMRRRSNAG
ncbi:MAG: VPLPA-CTERM sorting domain-containing protein [Pseudomonadota bacterium]